MFGGICWGRVLVVWIVLGSAGGFGSQGHPKT